MKVRTPVAKLAALLALGEHTRTATGQIWSSFHDINAGDSDPSLFPDHGFGWRVAITRDFLALIGSKHSGQYDSLSGTYAAGKGNARVYDMRGATETALLIADDGTAEEFVGYTVAIESVEDPPGTFRNYAAVGVTAKSDSNDGRVFTFAQDPVTEAWNPRETLTGFAGLPEVAMRSGRLVVGCPNCLFGEGRVRIYELTNPPDPSSLWNFHSELVPPDGSLAGRFGTSVDIHCGTIVVGSPGTGPVGNPWSGLAFVFDLATSGLYVNTATLTSPQDMSDPSLDYGGSVSVSRDRILVGNSAAVPFGTDEFARTDQACWSYSQTYGENKYGVSVAVEEGVVLIASNFDDPLTGETAVFIGPDSFPYEETFNEGTPGFAASVAMFTSTALVGAYDGGLSPGQVHFYGGGNTLNPSCPPPIPADFSFSCVDVPPPSPSPSPPTPPVEEVWCASGMFGDPHISTFDDLRFDCQAAGEFVMFQSAEDPDFVIQERFTAIEDQSACTQTSVSTGVAILDSVDRPKVQVSTPRTGAPSSNAVGGCPVDFYVDGVELTLPLEETKTYTTSGELEGWVDGPGHVSISAWQWGGGEGWDAGGSISIYNTDTMLSTYILVQNSERFGCHFAVQHYLPGTFRSNETKFGLLGTCNGDPADDWVTSGGTTLSPPATAVDALFQTSYDYCTQQWCVNNAADSIFTYGAGESFASINRCSDPYVSELEDHFADGQFDTLSQELRDTCGSSVACMIDGLCGDLNDAARALDTEALINDGVPSDWEIIYRGENIDFEIGSVHEVILDYDISAGRDYVTNIYEKACCTEDPPPPCDSPLDGSVISLATEEVNPLDSFYDKLIISYDVDRAAIVDSTLWSESTSELEFCQRVELVTPATDAIPGMPVVTEDTYMKIYMDLSVGFQFDNDVGGKANSQGGGTANFDGFVEAYKCDADGNPDPSPLLPNDELMVCVVSLSTDVEVAAIEIMAIQQDTTSLMVVEDSVIRNPSVTIWRTEPSIQGWLVTTRVPTRLPNGDRFSFQPGQTLTVSGTVELELASLIGRNLAADKASKNKKEASYQIQVELIEEEKNEEELSVFGVSSASLEHFGWISVAAVNVAIYAITL